MGPSVILRWVLEVEYYLHGRCWKSVSAPLYQQFDELCGLRQIAVSRAIFRLYRKVFFSIELRHSISRHSYQIWPPSPREAHSRLRSQYFILLSVEPKIFLIQGDSRGKGQYFWR
jgi:hypothetical protein